MDDVITALGLPGCTPIDNWQLKGRGDRVGIGERDVSTRPPAMWRAVVYQE
jgi:hypothetical protein